MKYVAIAVLVGAASAASADGTHTDPLADLEARVTVLENQPLPADGQDGRDGVDGLDGRDGAPGKDGLNGTPGAPGTNGVDGADGVDGQDGITTVTYRNKLAAYIAAESSIQIHLPRNGKNSVSIGYGNAHGYSAGGIGYARDLGNDRYFTFGVGRGSGKSVWKLGFTGEF